METLFVTRDATLRQRENTLSVTLGGKTTSLPIEKVRHLVLLAETSLNTRLLTLCGRHGVRVSVFDYYGYYKGTYEPVERNSSGEVKLAHARLVLDDEKRLAVAREIVRGATQNMRANLLYYAYRGNEPLAAAVAELDRVALRLGKAGDTAALMGTEGNLKQLYYAAWKHIDPRLDFGPRVRRPPNNPVNCLISFLNQLTYTVTRHELFKTHLEETFASLHAPGNGRSSLSLDLSEPFKPVLADQLIFRMYRKGMVEENWFDQHEGVCLLSETGRRHATEQFSRRIEEEHQGRSFRQWIYREALSLERHILGIAEYESFKRRP